MKFAILTTQVCERGVTEELRRFLRVGEGVGAKAHPQGDLPQPPDGCVREPASTLAQPMKGSMDNLTEETLRLAAERIVLIDNLIAHFQAERVRLVASLERLAELSRREAEINANAAEVAKTL